MTPNFLKFIAYYNQFYWFLFVPQDKSRLNMDIEEFQLRSKIMKIYDEFKTIDGIPNYDICLIKTESDASGINFDLSKKFNLIPCLPKSFSLSEVNEFCSLIHTKRLIKSHGAACWTAGWGKSHAGGVEMDTLHSVGVNLFETDHCRNHR